MKIFHGEFSSADATAAALGGTEPPYRFTLYPAGSKVALVLAATEQVVITDISLGSKTAMTFLKLFDGADAVADAGELIAIIESGTGHGGLFWTPSIPHRCQVGTYPKAIAQAAGQLDIVIRGIIESVA